MTAPTDLDFPGYRVIRPLELAAGAGVWEGEGIDSGGTAAIESLAGRPARDADAREWFAEAWRAAAAIDHPNVVSVEEIGTRDGVPFAARTPAGGATLAKHIAVNGALDPEGAVDLLGQVGAGLEAAHAAGVVHGALDPGSVIVEAGDEDGLHARLAGFGRAEGDRLEDLRDLGAILGAMLGGGRRPGGESAMDERLVALGEVVGRAGEGEFRSATELVAAAESAIGRGAGAVRFPGNAGRGNGGPSAPRSTARWALAALALVVTVAALVILTGGDEDPAPAGPGSGSPAEPAPAVEPGDPSATGDGTGAPPLP